LNQSITIPNPPITTTTRRRNRAPATRTTRTHRRCSFATGEKVRIKASANVINVATFRKLLVPPTRRKDRITDNFCLWGHGQNIPEEAIFLCLSCACLRRNLTTFKEQKRRILFNQNNFA
jgi:hypothetical protein